MASVPQAPKIPEIAYGAFCGNCDQANAQKVVHSLAIAMDAKVKHVHLLFQSAGGFVGDGVFLYNFFRSVPIEISLYNVGQISSAGVIAFLGAKTRNTSKSATFMIHRCANTVQFASATKLQHAAKSLILDDARVETIIKEHTEIPPEIWDEVKYHDVYFSGEESVPFGLATGFEEFAPPAGSRVFNILA